MLKLFCTLDLTYRNVGYYYFTATLPLKIERKKKLSSTAAAQFRKFCSTDQSL